MRYLQVVVLASVAFFVVLELIDRIADGVARYALLLVAAMALPVAIDRLLARGDSKQGPDE